MLDWLQDVSARPTKKTRKAEDPDMRAEYDFSGGARGKYAQRFARGSNVVVLEPDVAKRFKTSRSVNKVLREHAESARGRKASGS